MTRDTPSTPPDPRKGGRRRFLNSLSGRFLMLTVGFVMLAEVLIFVPSVARFREDFLLNRLERAQIASLALLAADDMITDDLEAELLENAGVLNVVLRRDEARQLMLSSPIPSPIDATFDLRDPTAFGLIRDAMIRLADPETRIIRVVGNPVRDAGLLIEVTVSTDYLRAAMLDYGVRILMLSAVISIVTAGLLFVAVRFLLVSPIKRVVGAMQSYAAAPEDGRRIIEPRGGVTELYEAELALQSMQTQLTSALRQKERLAQLGAAVAKVSHDLRNILTTAQLFADRVEQSEDPMISRVLPKLVNSISRAVALCEGTLAFGKAEEPPPRLTVLPLAPLVSDVVESERLATEGVAVGANAGTPAGASLTFREEVPAGLNVRADPEQLHRVISNLVRNARQAILASGPTSGDAEAATIRVAAREEEHRWLITVSDTGPGLPARARDHLFQPFQGAARKGGTGLGLAISADLVRGHGGRLTLERTGPEGTVFEIELPKLALRPEVSGA